MPKAIDIAVRGRSADAIAVAILEELLMGGLEIEVGLVFGRRVTLDTAEQGATQLAAGPGGCRGVGARGVTAQTIALAKDTGARLCSSDAPRCLTSRPCVPRLKRTQTSSVHCSKTAQGRACLSGGAGQAGKRIRAGREVRDAGGHRGGRWSAVRHGGVVDTASIKAALADVWSSWGPVTALVQLAPADKLLAEKTLEQFQFVFRTKVLGLQALLEATQDDPLKAIPLFSSVAARGGNVGQGDYAAANEVLKVAAAERARRGEHCVVKSLGWGPGDAVAKTLALKRHFESKGVPLSPWMAVRSSWSTRSAAAMPTRSSWSSAERRMSPRSWESPPGRCVSAFASTPAPALSWTVTA